MADDVTPWSSKQIAGALGLVLVAGGSSYSIISQRGHDQDDTRELGELSVRIKSNEERVTVLERSGSPAVQALEVLLKADEARLVILEAQVRAAAETRLSDQRAGVSQAAIDDIKHRVEDSNQQSQARDADLRSSIDRLTSIILGSTSKPLVGPR